MIPHGILIPAAFALPVLLAAASLLLRSPASILRLVAVGTAASSVLCAVLAFSVPYGGEISSLSGWIRLDSLSALHVAVMGVVFLLSALHGPGSFRQMVEDGSFDLRTARRYGSLWFGSLAAMLLVLLSNNLGLMWVGIEATTLLTAFLICVRTTPGSLEAMWKYLLMCSVGVALAFTGTLLFAASANKTGLTGTEQLLWSCLAASATGLDTSLLKAGFIFMVIGYGTKAGLAPMHNWLPDAHSQAPSPVSAIFSGFLLNAALYCILRCLPIVETATGGEGWAREILVAAGLISILTAAVFVVVQNNLKRMLAYSSLEHIGIIALGAGIGGAGAFAAMYHLVSHSIAKSMAFLSAGRLIDIYGTNDMRRIRGSLRCSPVWGAGLLTSLLVLVGTAPFAIFFTEFMTLRAAFDAGAYAVGAAFLAGVTIVFIGVLRKAIPMAWGTPDRTAATARTGVTEVILVALPLLCLLMLGLWMPPFLRQALHSAAAVIGGAR
jgi:hydrogenase-4 component F